MATTLTCIGTELESGRITLLGSEPWLSSNYGIVRLKNHPLTAAASRFREFIIEAENAASLEEERLLALHRSVSAAEVGRVLAADERLSGRRTGSRRRA